MSDFGSLDRSRSGSTQSVNSLSVDGRPAVIPSALVQSLKQLQLKDKEINDCKTEINRLTRANEGKQKEMNAILELVDRQRNDIKLAKEETASTAEENERLKEICQLKGVGQEEELRTVEITHKVAIECYGTCINKVTATEQDCDLRRGDQLIAVNGANVETMANDEIGKLISQEGTLTLLVRNNPERLKDFVGKLNEKKVEFTNCKDLDGKKSSCSLM